MRQLSFIRERYEGIGKGSTALCWLVSNVLVFSTVMFYLYNAKLHVLPSVEKRDISEKKKLQKIQHIFFKKKDI